MATEAKGGKTSTGQSPVIAAEQARFAIYKADLAAAGELDRYRDAQGIVDGAARAKAMRGAMARYNPAYLDTFSELNLPA